MKYINPLDKSYSTDIIGRKSYSLARVKEAGFFVPDSLCLNSSAYHDFLNKNNLISIIEVELGRKSMDDMRWEELWDCGLRIRNQIIHSTLSADLIEELRSSIPLDWLESGVAIRSSSPQEDMKNASFAGLYDSYIGCKNFTAITDSILKVWSSLWSDRSLLYRKEISLDVQKSSMAILMQKMILGEYSGVAFSRDPNEASSEYLMIEVVPGLCSGLVDGSVEPDHYKVSREDLKLHPKKQNKMSTVPKSGVLENLLHDVAKQLLKIETILKSPVDVEWTFSDARITILQVRPISYVLDSNEKRVWYLSLTPNYIKLKNLASEVKNKLIPELIAEGDDMEAEEVSAQNNFQLAETINSRIDSLHKWRHIYKEKFIPFAHGVREFGQYYNDTVKPEDPYEFTHLLKTKDRIARRRLQALHKCHQVLFSSAEAVQCLRSWVEQGKHELDRQDIENIRSMLNGGLIVRSYCALKNKYFDMTLKAGSWINRDDLIINLLLNFAQAKNLPQKNDDNPIFFDKYIAAAHDNQYAKSLLKIARLSWALRDDDNLLLSRLESQFLKVMNEGKKRLVDSGRLQESIDVGEPDAIPIISALKGVSHDAIKLVNRGNKAVDNVQSKIRPRQLKGQPAVPGTASGYACRISTLEDIKSFNPGDIIICDAVDPNMTHLVPLARGIVERRGGMLIHGVIIARELGIPCVNGVGSLLERIISGDYITIDGTLGLVIVGDPDFSFGEL